MKSKPFSIPKLLVWNAYNQIKKNGGSAGVDNQSLEDFDKNLSKNLYKIWNRLSSGSYLPPAILGVDIPKKNGGVRTLGIPTVSDRIAQMAIKLALEPKLEPIFDQDSYGYRPNRSAHDAIAVTRKRCWKRAWVLEFDIKGLFDNIPHDLLMKALKVHTKNQWILLYIERWLKVSIVKDGETISRHKGTPQGGVISPLLANLFLHYCFDLWMRKEHPGIDFCRYADDGLCHTDSKEQAEKLLVDINSRFKECGLEVHPGKTKIVYCKTSKRKENHPVTSFDFLGFTFRPRMARDKRGEKFLSFLPGASSRSLKKMRQTVRDWKLHFKSNLSIESLSRMFNPMIRGWYNYYCKFCKTSMYSLWLSINSHLAKWLRWKCKKVRTNKTKSVKVIQKIAGEKKYLFVHWQNGYRNSWG